MDYDRGIEMICLVPWDVCTIKMTGWFYGKTYGLLGTFNHEPHDDFMNPKKQIVTDVEEFADSWRLRDDCLKKNYAPRLPMENLIPEECEMMFTTLDSALSPCFSHLDTAPFKAMCAADMIAMTNRANIQRATCQSAAAYVASCRAVGVDLWMPPKCGELEGT